LTGKADAASIAAIAEKLAEQIDVTTIEELWLFPTRRVSGVESTVFALALHGEDEMRRVLTAHVRAIRNKRGEPTLEFKIDEHASAPAERLPRVIEGVLRRLSDDFASTPPSHALLNGSAEKWQALMEVLMSAKANEPLPEELLTTERLENVDD
jgi:hypothetical protein